MKALSLQLHTSSEVDVTFVRITAGVAVNDWRVLTELNSGSDHLYLESGTLVPGSTTSRSRITPGQLEGWSVKTLDSKNLADAPRCEPRIYELSSTEEMASQVQNYVREIWDASMPRRTALQARSRFIDGRMKLRYCARKA